MEIKTVRALIISGDGINADNELSIAFNDNGAFTTNIHINSIIENPSLIHQYDILAFPGGFSFGDEIRSGKVLAIKIRNAFINELLKFKQDKKLILGICNGFQVLVQLNLFAENFEQIKKFTLTTNTHGEFKNFWTKVNVINSKSPWLKDITESFYLPVRHKEGRIFGELDSKLYALKYEEDINGSVDQIAGIVDSSGLVFGLMPHPEAATSVYLSPENTPANNYIFANLIFKNAVNYIQNKE